MFSSGILVLLLLGFGFIAGLCYASVKTIRLRQEIRQLKRLLNNMRRVDEISFRAFCGMSREVAHASSHANVTVRGRHGCGRNS